MIFLAVGSVIFSALVLSLCCFFCCCACVVGSFYKMHTSIKDLDHAVQLQMVGQIPNMSMAQMVPTQSISRGQMLGNVGIQ